MPKKNTRNTKGRIVAAAWKLFYEQGYEETTVEDIIFESETSKGSFYHYFDGKDALLSSLSVLFDERYEELMRQQAAAVRYYFCDGCGRKNIKNRNHSLAVCVKSIPLSLCNFVILLLALTILKWYSIDSRE